jgi:hypothetical protein
MHRRYKSSLVEIGKALGGMNKLKIDIKAANSFHGSFISDPDARM